MAGNIEGKQATFLVVHESGNLDVYPKLWCDCAFGNGRDVMVAAFGSDGKWRAWLSDAELTPFYASNVGICRPLSPSLGRRICTAILVKALKTRESSGDVTRWQNWAGFWWYYSHPLWYGKRADISAQSCYARAIKIIRARYHYNDLLPDVSDEKLLSSLKTPKTIAS